MKLYSTPISPMGKRVSICARELGVTVEHALVDFQKGEHRSPDHLTRNPTGKVPVLIDGDLVLWESAAILCYLAQKANSPLWPDDPRELAEVMRWMFFTSCHIDPYLTTLVVERFAKGRQGLPPDEALTANAEQWLARFLPIVEEQLAARELLTGRFSLADIAVGCSLDIAPLVQHDLGPYPNIRGWLDRLHARESWRPVSREEFT